MEDTTLTKEQKEAEELMFSLDKTTIEHWMTPWVKNALENYTIIPRDRPKTISHLRHIHYGEEAIITASGPSLDDCLPYMKDFKGRIFATNSTANPLIANGINPDWTVILDADTYVANQFKDLNTKRMKMILATYSAANAIKLFSIHLCWWFNIFDDRHWFLKEGLHIAFPTIDGLLASTCASGAAARLACTMGISKMYLVGFDFGFPGGRHRCTNYKKIAYAWIPDGIDQYCIDRSEEKEIEGIKTTIKLQVAHAAISHMIHSLGGIEVINCSKGLSMGFPRMEFKDAIK
jgi:hypothetical protein